jgi:hypothetical protein
LIYFTSSVIKHKLNILAYYPNTLNADNIRQKNEISILDAFEW